MTDTWVEDPSLVGTAANWALPSTGPISCILARVKQFDGLCMDNRDILQEIKFGYERNGPS